MFKSGLLSSRRLPCRTVSGSAGPLYTYNGILDVLGYRGSGMYGDGTTQGNDLVYYNNPYEANGVCCGTNSYGSPYSCYVYYFTPLVNSGSTSFISNTVSNFTSNPLAYGYATQSWNGRYYGFSDIAVGGHDVPPRTWSCQNNLTSAKYYSDTYQYNGDGYVLAIRFDGTLWGWGYNSNGQLGDNSTSTRTSMVQIGGGYDWKKVRTGLYYTLALKGDGTLWAWGYNAYGQLGTNNTTTYSSPVQVSGTWNDIDCGREHSIGIKSDGTLWAWGYNGGYSVGDGTTTNRSSPVQISSNTTWTKLACGYGYSFAIRSDGSAYAWGYNTNYQCGVNSYSSNVTTPSIVYGGYTWRSIAAGYSRPYGYYNGYGVTTDGKAYAWGYYPYGLSFTALPYPSQIGANVRHLDVPYGYSSQLWAPFYGGLWYGNTGLQGFTFITTERYLSTYYAWTSTRSIMYSGNGAGGCTSIVSNASATFMLKTGNLR